GASARRLPSASARSRYESSLSAARIMATQRRSGVSGRVEPRSARRIAARRSGEATERAGSTAGGRRWRGAAADRTPRKRAEAGKVARAHGEDQVGAAQREPRGREPGAERRPPRLPGDRGVDEDVGQAERGRHDGPDQVRTPVIVLVGEPERGTPGPRLAP